MVSKLSCIFLFLSGACKGAMDMLHFHFYKLPQFFKDRYMFWNPDRSWVLKWKDGLVENGEAFPLSSTLLVFLTDGWHLIQFFMISFITLAVVFESKTLTGKKIETIKPFAIKALVIFIVYRISFGLGFILIYH